MISKLNLASQPFRNRTLPWAVAAVVSVLSLLALAYTLSEYRGARAEADLAARQVETLRRERGELEAQAKEIRQNIPPEQLEALKAAHELVEDRAFSWSQLFSDLEAALPASVRVARINVREVQQYGGQTRADLDLSVVGRAPDDVTGMMEKMRRGGVFLAVPVSSNQKSGKGESGFEWALRVQYVQRARQRSEEEPGGEVGAGRDENAEDLARAGGQKR